MSKLVKKSKSSIVKESTSLLLEDGAYPAVIVGVMAGDGYKYQSEDEEEKLSYIFAIPNGKSVKYISTNWMRYSIYVSDTQPSALWKILKPAYKAKTAEVLFDADGDFDPTDPIGKKVQLVLETTSDGKYNKIVSYISCNTEVDLGDKIEIPSFMFKENKIIKNVEHALIDGAVIKESKKDAEFKIAESAASVLED